ncbi:MAG: hypothetical protein AAGF15_03305, partial [Pseudomonadota bacterium]
VVTGANDDSLDWVQGWTGSGQFILVVQNPNFSESDQGIEADNLSADNDALPRSSPILSNMTFVGASGIDPASGLGDLGFLIREGTAGSFNNFIITGFADACIDIDDAATFAQAAAGAITFDSALLDCPGEIFDEDEGDEGDVSDIVTSGDNIVIADNTLAGPIPFVNGPAEIAVPAVDETTLGDFFVPAGFIGAVPVSGPFAPVDGNFTIGWTFGVNPDPTCPEVDGVLATVDGTTCILTGTITDDITLVAGLEYELDGFVFIGEDQGPFADAPTLGDDGEPVPSATLTIDAGVIVTGQDQDSALIVQRGSRLVANGLVSAPITFQAATTDFTLASDIATAVGEWGGLVINGRAPINAPSSEIEDGLTAAGEAGTGLYGGDDPTDDSGVLNFVRVLFAGDQITTETELNGIALQGVGNGTDIDSVQVHNNADDGIEFFGGTVNVKRLVITGANDDSIDWVQGWQGTLQFGVVAQNPVFSESDNGIEADNLSADNDALPRSSPTLSNLTLVGASATLPGEGLGDIGMLIREGTGVRMANVLVTGFSDFCFDLDDAATFALVNQADIGAPLNPGTFDNVTLQSVAFDCPGTAIDVDDGDPFDTTVVFLTEETNILDFDNTLQLTTDSTGAVTFVNGPTENGLTATSPTSLDPIFEEVDFVGAISGPETDFTVGWTVFLDSFAP